jgi:hypothetical protein
MTCLFLFAAVLAGTGALQTDAPAGDRAAYEAAARRAGESPAEHLRLALWCEVLGLAPERDRHLALAITYEPRNLLAHGLAGQVNYKGRWLPASAAEREARAHLDDDVARREYLNRRASTPHTADAQLKLASWCAESGLKQQAIAHYIELSRIDPSRESVWKHLGFKKQGRRWVNSDVAAAQKIEAERQRHADQRWKARIERMRDGLEGTDSARRARARDDLAAVTDPGSVPTIVRVFGNGSEARQTTAVRLLAQIRGPAASQSLAALALDSQSAAVRQGAAEVIALRDPRDVIAPVIARVRKPYRYEVKPALGPGSPSDLIVDGQRFDIQRLHPMPNLDIIPFGVVQFDGLPTVTGAGNNPVQSGTVLAELSARLSAYQAQQRQMAIANTAAQIHERDLAVERTVQNQIRLIEDLNARINDSNERVLPLLEVVTGQTFGANPEPWRNWWIDQLDLTLVPDSSGGKPTTAETVKLPKPNEAEPKAKRQRLPLHACFVAGTLVHAIDGPRPVESIQVGDLVFSQNTTSGEISLQPVLAVHRIKPTPTVKVFTDRDHEAFAVTGIHRFWMIGNGWTMAADLKAGDKLRAIAGVVTVQAIESDATEPVFNFDVAQNRSFFTGKAGLLVHDFSFVPAVLAPFDRLVEMAASPPPAARTAPSTKAAPHSR